MIDDFDDLDPVRLAVHLCQLAETDPENTLLFLVRQALEVADLRREYRRTHREISQQISAGTDWRAVAANHVPFDELQRRRAVPGPMASGGAA